MPVILTTEEDCNVWMRACRRGTQFGICSGVLSVRFVKCGDDLRIATILLWRHERINCLAAKLAILIEFRDAVQRDVSRATFEQ